MMNGSDRSTLTTTDSNRYTTSASCNWR
jgi:hypothetical protein